MDAAEAADRVRETAEERHKELIQEHEAKIEDQASKERFRNRAALVIAVLAGILAICELGSDDAMDRTLNNNIQASDTWNFYQAKNMRQTAYQLAADELKRQLSAPGLSPPARASLQADVQRYQKTVVRYESEPGKDGKKQLQARARGFEEARDKAESRKESFDLAQMLLQLGVVLGSVSILALSRPLLWAACALGGVGLALVINGYFLLVPIG